MVAQGKKPDTLFAPAERAGHGELVGRLGLLLQDVHSLDLLEVSPGFLLVLDEHRQIVYANEAFLSFLGSSLESVVGQRPGEALACLNCPKDPGGCGTGEACRNCGAVISIMKCMKEGQAASSECRIVRDSGDGFESLDLRVNVLPMKMLGGDYMVFTALDIGDEKRRKFFEETFLHDIRNSAGNILTMSGLLKDGEGGALDREMCVMLYEAAASLISDIDGQRMLHAAESRDLKVNPVNFDALQFIQKLARAWNRSPQSQDKHVAVGADSRSFALESDPEILERVLGNLLKNALEASGKGQSVTLSCALREGGQALFTVRNSGFVERPAQLGIFQRSFSTKGVARGIGTYMSRLLAERYLGGRISFRSSEADGTEFVVGVPLAR